MKSIFISIFTIFLLSFAEKAKSQDTIKIPVFVAKQIAKDLVSYDSARAELLLSKQRIDLLNLKVDSYNKSISVYQEKEVNYVNQLNLSAAKLDIWKKEYNDLANRYRSLKLKNTRTQIIAGVLVGTLTYFAIKR
jgi:hypothetical protein